MSCSGSSPIDRLAQIGRSTSTRRATVQIRYASTNGVRIYRYVLYLQAMPQARTVMLALVLKLPLALLIVRILRHCLPPGFPYRCPDIPQVLMYILGHLHCSGHRGRQRHPLIEAGRRLWRLEAAALDPAGTPQYTRCPLRLYKSANVVGYVPHHVRPSERLTSADHLLSNDPPSVRPPR